MTDRRKADASGAFVDLFRKQIFIPIAALLLLTVFNLAVDPSFFKVTLGTNSAGNPVLTGYLMTILDYGSEVAILAIGMTLVTAASGGQDISVGAAVAIAGSVILRVLVGLGGDGALRAPIFVGFLAACLVAMFFGAFNGVLVEMCIRDRDYQTRYRDEVREFEQFSLRRFFEKLLDGTLSVKEIYEEAAARSLQLTAPCYNLLLFSIYEKGERPASGAGEQLIRRQEEVFHFFLRHPQYILFRLNIDSYGVLIKSEPWQMEELVENSLALSLIHICHGELMEKKGFYYRLYQAQFQI